MSDGKTGLQLRSLIKKSGELEISLVDVPTPSLRTTKSSSGSRRHRSIRPTSACSSVLPT